MRVPLFLSTAIILTSCGAFNSSGDKSIKSKRHTASMMSSKPFFNEHKSFNDVLEEKLKSLQGYYLIGHENLQDFDHQIKELPLDKLYESRAYLNLIAVRALTEEIEEELFKKWSNFPSDKSSNDLGRSNMEAIIQAHAQKSPYTSMAMENLMNQLNILPPQDKGPHNKNGKIRIGFPPELKEMTSKKFGVYLRDVEHLSHQLNIKQENQEKIFYPSPNRPGNIVGSEFPAKVWNLTFDDGPGPKTSQIILNNLKQRGLKATFFQLTKNVASFPKVAQEIREAGMEIASHSYTHKQLTKVAPLVLEQEITIAVQELSKLHGQEIKFFRLPYGAGVNHPLIRNKIAENKLIHVFWNVDTLDWMPQEPTKIVQRTLALMKKSAKDSGVILFHDIHKRTTEATPKIMDHLKKDGRRVCTLDEIVTQMNEGEKIVCPAK